MMIRDYAILKRAGKRLGREGLSERVFCLVDEFNENRSYKNAIVLCGRLRAIALACNADSYWSEKMSTGYQHELCDIQEVSINGTKCGGEKSWWIK